MYRLFFIFLILVDSYAAIAIADDPSSVNAQEGKAVYTPIAPAVSVMNESNIQKEDQNSTGHGQAK